MKLFLLATAILFCSCFTFGQQENRSIQGQKLTFSITDTLMDDVQQRILSIYASGKEKPLFTANLENIQKECNSETVMIGDYEATDSTLILYRYWAKAGYAPSFLMEPDSKPIKSAQTDNCPCPRTCYFLNSNNPAKNCGKIISQAYPTSIC